MAPYPTELRTRVVAAVEHGGMTIGEVARVFNVGVTFVKKMLRLSRAGEDLAPRQGGGSAQAFPVGERKKLRVFRQRAEKGQHSSSFTESGARQQVQLAAAISGHNLLMG